MSSLPVEAEELIAGRKRMAHLATSVADRPHVAPVWYDYADGRFRILTAGRKLENARRNPRVAVSIQADRDGDALWFVVARGTATVVDDVAAINDAALAIYGTYVGGDPEEWDEFYTDHLGDSPPNDLLVIDVASMAYDVYEA